MKSINSRTAIAGAIIGLLLVFLQFKEFELYWCAVFFTTRRGVLEKSFFIQFYWSDLKAAFKSSFLQFLMVMRLDYDIVLVVGLF